MKKNILRSSLIAIFATGLTACGGGGGDSTSETSNTTYSGLTEPASIDSPDTVSTYVEIYQDTTNAAAGLESLSFGTSTPASTSTLASISMKSKAASESASGSCGGSATLTDNSTDSLVNLSIDANNFCEYDYDDNRVTIDGFMSMSGTFEPMNMRVVLKEFSMSHPAYDVSTWMDGNMETTQTDQYIETFSTKLTVNSTTGDETYMVKDWKERYYSSSDEVVLTGRMYHPTYGYVTVTTVENVQMDYYANNPISGVLLLQGANSSANVTFSSEGYYVEVDQNGDDIIDYTNSYSY